MTFSELKDFLEEKVHLYNRSNFIESDPIQIPHRFTQKEDQEIAGFFAATMAWGNRKMIINKSNDLIQRMGESPYDFVMNYSKKEFPKIESFKHRTMNSLDVDFFLRSLQNIYTHHQGLESCFKLSPQDENTYWAILSFREKFLETEHLERSKKHISNPAKGSAAKRLNMMLRWFVRKDKQGVDLGIWSGISTAQLICPLDVHSGNVARKLGLIQRKQNDWKAALELNETLIKLDPNDPVKYDFALFGLGIFEGFTKL